MDFLKIQENLKKLKKTGEDLTEYLKESVNIKIMRDNLLENSSERIIYKLKELKYKELDRKDFSKIVLLMRYLDQHDLDEYRTYLKESFNAEDFQEKPEKPEEVSKESIYKYNEELKLWNKSIDKTKEWNRNYKFLIDSLNDTITLDLYGDTSLNSDDLYGVYFKFYETNVSDIEVFIHEIRNSPSEAVQNVKKVELIDISGHVPEQIESAHEVFFYFQEEEEAILFRENETVAYGVYEKFIIRSNMMKKVGGEWGLDSERKDNFNDSSSFSNTNASHGHITSPNQPSTLDIFEDDYEVDIEDCIYSEKVHEDGSMVFIIQPSDFFQEFETILNNPKLVINGITDDNNWDKRDDGSYSYRKGYAKALEFLDERTRGFDSKLDNYVIDMEKSTIETLTEDEIFKNYVNNGKGFKPYDLEFNLVDGDGDLLVNAYPKGLDGYDQHLPLVRDVYNNIEISEIMETVFEITEDDYTFTFNQGDIEKVYNFLTGIGMRPCTEDLLDDTLEKL
jgi:hypothetical protein